LETEGTTFAQLEHFQQLTRSGGSSISLVDRGVAVHLPAENYSVAG